jgi:heterotetrameric sarcosine oxidase delta subunit
VGLNVPCPTCGPRPYPEFAFGGELRPIEAEDANGDFDRVFLRENVDGVQVERWFHLFGCRRWLTVRRDTRTDRIEG